MRILSAFALLPFLAACATQTPAPAPAKPAAAAPAPAAAAPAPESKPPQCWNGDQNRFENVGAKATIAGVAVECKATSNGKSAYWIGIK